MERAIMNYQVAFRVLAVGALVAGVTVLGPLAARAADSASSQSAEMKQLDTDNDGTVSESEYTDSAKAHFKAMDKNGDGKLTQDEMAAMHGKHRHDRGHATGGGMGMGGMVTTHPMQGD